jgi:hypothetical protein
MHCNRLHYLGALNKWTEESSNAVSENVKGDTIERFRQLQNLTARILSTKK